MRTRMRKAIAMIGTAACSAMNPAGPAWSQDAKSQRTIMVVVAHPDDELFIAPAIASEAEQGARVEIIYATSGDAGPGVSGMDKGEALALRRKREAVCAADALGATPIFLDFGDGVLADAAGRTGSVAAALRQRLNEEITRLRPEVVMTWGPDGGYGHPDHRMVSTLTTEIIQAMEPDARPNLYFAGILEDRASALEAFGRWGGTHSDLLTIECSYGADELTQSIKAAQCHETQFDKATRDGLMLFFDSAIWHGKVRFREAF